MKKKLVIIGAGYQQIEAYKIAKSLGHYVIGTDIDPEAPAFNFADFKLICSTRNPDETLNSTKSYVANYGQIHGVMTMANDVPVTVSKVADFFDLPSTPVAVAVNTSSKLTMKEKWAGTEVKIPKYSYVKDISSFQKEIAKFNFPCIVKPTDGRGSKGVFYVEENCDLEWIFSESIKHSDSGSLLIEEYIAGPQLSVESIFFDDKFYPIAFADRNYTRLHQFKPYIIEDGGVLPSGLHQDLLSEVGKTVEKASRLLGVSWGTVKADIVINDGVIYILELASRLSGGFLASHHIPRTLGINLIEVVIKLALGESIKVSDITPKHKSYLGVRYFFTKPGRLTEIDLPETDEFLEIDQYKFVGDYMPPISNSGVNVGYVLATANSYEVAKKRVEDYVSQVTVKTEEV
ncbi:MAG: ATP-grasp domain-containing protein [Candidatus Caenarcaniphilales bacterium]|nr:ATP-grasp domain-containing protein [Candidatus Caenarcaniphilales bacterium]